MASKYDKREDKIKSKQERVERMQKALDQIAKKSKKDSLEGIERTKEGIVFTRGALKPFDNEHQDLYGYLHYGLMKSSSFLEKVEKEPGEKQKYLYRTKK